MHLRRHLHAYAVVRTLLVVELDEAREALLCVLDGLETALAVAGGTSHALAPSPTGTCASSSATACSIRCPGPAHVSG